MQKIWFKSVISALWSSESNLQRHIEGSHRALYFQSRSQRNIEQQCTTDQCDAKNVGNQQKKGLLNHIVRILHRNTGTVDQFLQNHDFPC